MFATAGSQLLPPYMNALWSSDTCVWCFVGVRVVSGHLAVSFREFWCVPCLSRGPGSCKAACMQTARLCGRIACRCAVQTVSGLICCLKICCLSPRCFGVVVSARARSRIAYVSMCQVVCEKCGICAFAYFVLRVTVNAAVCDLTMSAIHVLERSALDESYQ